MHIWACSHSAEEPLVTSVTEWVESRLLGESQRSLCWIHLSEQSGWKKEPGVPLPPSLCYLPSFKTKVSWWIRELRKQGGESSLKANVKQFKSPMRRWKDTPTPLPLYSFSLFFFVRRTATYSCTIEQLHESPSLWVVLVSALFFPLPNLSPLSWSCSTCTFPPSLPNSGKPIFPTRGSGSHKHCTMEEKYTYANNTNKHIHKTHTHTKKEKNPCMALALVHFCSVIKKGVLVLVFFFHYYDWCGEEKHIFQQRLSIRSNMFGNSFGRIDTTIPRTQKMQKNKSSIPNYCLITITSLTCV